MCLAVAVPGAAWADDPPDLRDLALRAAGVDLRPGFGLRVGGYGQREVTQGEGVDWMSCRMNGLGVFGTLSFTPWVFGEVSIDVYQATSGTVEDEGMDRISFQGLAAVGLRAFPDAIVSPVVQLGVGAEHTTVEALGTGADTQGIYPLGFVGAGAEVNATDHFRLGANLRLYGMAAFAVVNQAEITPGGAAITARLQPEAALAGQLQLWVRYDL